MGSRESLYERQLLTTGVVKRVTSDTPVAIRLMFERKITTAGASLSITSVVVTSATDITVTWSDASTTAYDITDGNLDTVGKLATAIEGDGNFQVKVLDSLLSQAIDGSELLGETITAATVDGILFYDIKLDTSAAKEMVVRISPASTHFVGLAPANNRVHLQEIKYLANVNAASANSVLVYDCYGSQEQVVYSATTVDNSATTINWRSGVSKLSSADNGHELVVIVKDGTSLADGGYLEVTGEIE